MSEEVETPMGRMTVLRSRELEAQMDYRDRKYIRQADGSYECPTCGSTIQSISVSHPVWDGPFAMCGSGRVFYESRPHCPKCEEPPTDMGNPIAPKGSYHNP